MWFSRWLLTVLLLAGCARGKSTSAATATGGATLGAGKAAAATGGRWGVAFANASEGRTPAGCGALADAVASNFATGRSVVVVRFDYQTKRPLGFAQLSSPAKCTFYSEKRARVCAKADSALKLAFDPTTTGTWLRPDAGERGPWVFYQASRDRGGVVVVDDDFATVFSASIQAKGEGEILAPAAWATKDLGLGCRPAKQVTPPAQAYDLRSGSTMTAAESAAIAGLAQKTVLPGLWETWGGDAQVLLVLLYPRTAGDFAPQTAEYLVFLRGWTASN